MSRQAHMQDAAMTYHSSCNGKMHQLAVGQCLRVPERSEVETEASLQQAPALPGVVAAPAGDFPAQLRHAACYPLAPAGSIRWRQGATGLSL